MRLPPGTRLGPYEIVAALGAGGMGEVYRARDPRLGREVAIKVLPEHLCRDPQALARFEREAKAIAALSHPNILAIFDVGTEQGVSYAVTELLEGETLRARLQQTALAWRKAVEAGVALAGGLAAAHSKGIIHRDLKPENIFITTDGRVKILDFGLARFQPAQSPHNETLSHAGTQPGTVLGTVGYMSPEQVRGEPAGPSSDIFALGGVLYEMVSGRRAFRGQTTAETMSAILRDAPAELAASGTTIPAELDRLISHCLEKNPEERLQSARDLAFGLKALLGASGAPAAPPSGPTKVIDSIAVLPFVNASRDPDAEYLSDGITESIINSLTQIAQLRVMPRSTVFRYRGQDVDPQAVGRELKVRVVLTGRVLQRGEALVVGTELVDIEKDPGYALAYSGLADCYSMLTIFDAIPRREGLAKAKAAAAAAAALDAELAEGHKSLAFIRAFADWDWAGAEREFQRAAELDPSYWVTPYWHGLILAICGRYEEAGREIQRALQLEPLSPIVAHMAALISILSRRYPQAIEHCTRGLEVDSNYPLLRLWLGAAYEWESRYQEAIAEMETAWRAVEGSAIAVAMLGHAYALAGRRAEAEKLLHELQGRVDRGQAFDPYALVTIYIGLGQKDQALEWLDKACGYRSSWLTCFAKGDPSLDPLRPDPGFQRILQRMGLAPER